MTRHTQTSPGRPAKTSVRRKTQHRYVWLHQILLNDIESGKYPVGSLLPTEAQLSATFGVSRHTVREATRKLVDAGMIARYPSIGTVVKSTRPGTAQPSFIAGLGNMQDIFSYTDKTRLEVFGQGLAVADAAMAESMHCEVGSKWVVFHANRRLVEDGRIISYSQVYIRPEFERLKERLNGDHPSFYKMLQDDYGQEIHRIRQQIEATLMPGKALPRLELAAGSPALLMVRAYYDRQDRLLVVSENYYIADRFKLRSDWTPDIQGSSQGSADQVGRKANADPADVHGAGIRSGDPEA